ncbi:Protein of unknown function, partial [Cotesia congregata]
SVPLLWALMSNKNEECYANIFQLVKREFPNLKITKCMSDFETAIENAAKSTFPGVVIKHCYFHYAQAIQKNAKRLGLVGKKTNKYTHPEIYIVLSQIKYLAILPAEFIEETYERIKAYCRDEFGELFDEFFDYYERQWIKKVKPEGFTVYDMDGDRTDNWSESRQRDRNNDLKKNPYPNIFIILQKFVCIEA